MGSAAGLDVSPGVSTGERRFKNKKQEAETKQQSEKRQTWPGCVKEHAYYKTIVLLTFGIC